MENDLISRQAAIDAICADWCANYQNCGYRASLHGEKFCDGCDDIEKLKQLPSAQPEVAKDINVPSTDCISRQAAIDEILGQPPEPHYPSWYAEQIKRLPTAQPDLPEAYAKKVWTWLLDYQTTAAELKAKYSAYEVLSWVVNDWRRGHGGLN